MTKAHIGAHALMRMDGVVRRRNEMLHLNTTRFAYTKVGGWIFLINPRMHTYIHKYTHKDMYSCPYTQIWTLDLMERTGDMWSPFMGEPVAVRGLAVSSGRLSVSTSLNEVLI
jgi:hypothetical protein